MIRTDLYVQAQGVRHLIVNEYTTSKCAYAEAIAIARSAITARETGSGYAAPWAQVSNENLAPPVSGHNAAETQAPLRALRRAGLRRAIGGNYKYTNPHCEKHEIQNEYSSG
jgi:hypothetical protein